MGEISFSKERLASVSTSFEDKKDTIVSTIEKIEDSLLTIDSKWSGPEHDSATSDKNGALDNMKKAKEIVTNMDGAFKQLSANASKVSYND